MTALIQEMEGVNWKYSVIIKYMYYLQSNIVLFESGLVLAVNVYCNLWDPKKSHNFLTYAMKGKNETIKYALLKPQKTAKTWKTTGIKNESNKQKTVTNIANIVG